MSSIIYVQRSAALFIWCPLTSIMQDWITSTLDSFSMHHCLSIMKSDWCDYMFINAQAFNTKNIIYYEIVDLEVVMLFHSLLCFGRITTCTSIREEKVKYLIGMSIQKPSVCCTGGSLAPRCLHRSGTTRPLLWALGSGVSTKPVINLAAPENLCADGRSTITAAPNWALWQTEASHQQKTDKGQDRSCWP